MSRMIVADCPCGALHYCDVERWTAFQRISGPLPATVTVICADGTFVVPRLYIALHGLNGQEVAALAAQYDWPRTD